MNQENQNSGEALPELTQQESSRYSRHLILPEIGKKGQQKLKASKVLIIGAGGLGCPTSLYLAAAGVGTIGLVDADVVDDSNLQRQVLFGVSSIGKPKVEEAKRRLNDLNPYIKIKTYQNFLTKENALEIIADYDLVIDGTDNFATRYLVNDACVMLGKPNCYGSIFRFDGQASVFNYEGGPCYRCMFPEPPPRELVPSCSEGGVLGILPSIIGSIQATEAVKVIAGIGETLSGRLLNYDALRMKFRQVKIKKNKNCKICGEEPSITELIDYNQFCGIPSQEEEAEIDEITVQNLKERIDKGESQIILDVRELFEREISTIPKTIHIPMNEVKSRFSELDASKEIIIHCKTGGRSAKVCKLLLDNNFSNVKNLKGGVNAWAEEIDTSLPTY